MLELNLCEQFCGENSVTLPKFLRQESRKELRVKAAGLGQVLLIDVELGNHLCPIRFQSSDPLNRFRNMLYCLPKPLKISKTPEGVGKKCLVESAIVQSTLEFRVCLIEE